MEETHLARTKSIYIRFPLMLEWNGCTCSCCAAELSPPSTAPDIANDITIAAELLILARSIINNRVDPAGEEFPGCTAMPGYVVIISTLPHGYIEVPCYDEAIAGTCVENTFGRRATDELGGSVEREGRDPEAVSRFVIAEGVEGRLGILYGVGD